MKASRRKQRKSRPRSQQTSPKTTSRSKQDASSSPSPAELVTPGAFEGPLAPDVYEEEAFMAEGELGGDVSDGLKMKLPKLPEVQGARRRRRRVETVEEDSVDGGAGIEKSGDDKAKQGGDVSGVEAGVKKLVGSYLARGNEEKELIAKIEVDPDFMFREPDEGSEEYDMTAAIIGVGRKTKQGVYILPYLQSGYIVGLLVWLLCAFVYYPGFPLTELSDNVRQVMKNVLGAVYSANVLMTIYGMVEAKKRNQPVFFWGLKISLLGVLALNELMSNIPTKKRKNAKKSRAR